MATPSTIEMLAACFLAGEPGEEAIVARSSQLLGRNWPWLRPLAKRFSKNFRNKTTPRRSSVIRFLREDEGFRKAWSKNFHKLTVRRWNLAAPSMRPLNAFKERQIPALKTPKELADWLGISPTELEWFADLKLWGRRSFEEKLRHYRYCTFEKRSGDLRLIEAPKPRLKEIQRKILVGILERIPFHPAVHGFVKKRSALSFASSHVRREVVLKMDLKDFFPSVTAVRIQGFFRTLGYPEQVADLLGGLCTNSAPKGIWNAIRIDRGLHSTAQVAEMYAIRHLPQGAPTSPLLANLCFYRADCRLNGFAKSVGAKYSRYADDLAFSGGIEFRRMARKFSIHAASFVREEGFSVQHRKTRILRRGTRQALCGIIVNEKMNISRREYDLLKAILFNCIKNGAESQNRSKSEVFHEHLKGRVGFVRSVHPQRGEKLQVLFEQIRWRETKIPE